MCKDINWDQLTDLGERVEWERPESFDYRDIDSDWPYAESEDYYQAKSDFSHLISWQPPKKAAYYQQSCNYCEISPEEFNQLTRRDDLVYFYACEEEPAAIFNISELKEQLDELKEAYIFAFPRKFVLPTRSSFEKWYPYSVFYQPSGEAEPAHFLSQFIIAKMLNDNLYQNLNYCDQRDTKAKEFLEQAYHDTLNSHAEHIQEMVYAEPSSNRRIFGIDAQSAFLDSAKQIHGECNFS